MSTSVDISVWIAELATRVAGAPNETLRQELAGTLREFFVSSGSWVVKSQPMNLVADQDVYRITPLAQGDILYTYGILIDDSFVRFGGTEEPGVIRLAVKPGTSKEGAMVAVVAIRPRSYDVVPQNTETYDFDTILDGAMGRLFDMPDKPWANTVNAKYHLKRFKVGMGRARVRTRGMFTKQDEGFRFPNWA